MYWLSVLRVNRLSVPRKVFVIRYPFLSWGIGSNITTVVDPFSCSRPGTPGTFAVTKSYVSLAFDTIACSAK